MTSGRFLLLHTTVMLSWMLVQEVLRPLVTLTLISSSKAVCHHIDVCIKQLSYCSVKLIYWSRLMTSSHYCSIQIFSQGSVATVCRWSGQMNNCCVAIYLGILYAKIKKIGQCLHKLQQNKKGEHFLEHSVYLRSLGIFALTCYSF